MGAKTEIEDTIVRNCVLDNCRQKVSSVGSTSGIIPNNGVTQLTSTGAVTVIMAAPVAGASKRLIKSSTSTSVLTVTSPTTTVLFNATGNTNVAFDAADDFIDLIGLSATRWMIVTSASVALS